MNDCVVLIIRGCYLVCIDISEKYLHVMFPQKVKSRKLGNDVRNWSACLIGLRHMMHSKLKIGLVEGHVPGVLKCYPQGLKF